MSKEELKQQELTKLSGIFKGLVIYKEETEKLNELMKKYPFEAFQIFGKEECFDQFKVCFGAIG